MILCVDIGTSSVKGGVFGESGRCADSTSRPIAMEINADPLVHEIDPGKWIDAIRDIASELLSPSRPPACVVISGNGPTLVAVGRDGRPVRPAITWMDRRAAAESSEVSAAAGMFIDASFNLPKALRLRRTEPAAYDRSERFLSCPEYAMFAITGRAVAVLPASGFAPYLGEPSVIEAVGLDPAKFAPFVRLGEIVGNVSAAGSVLTGIPEGVPVVAGGPDFIAALVGTATTVPGRACDRAGTSEGINLCSPKGYDDPRLLYLPHVIEPYVNVSGVISTSGKAVEWWKKVTGRGLKDFDDFFEDVCAAAPGASSLVFLPYLSGERSPIWDSQARGTFIGMTLAHGRKEMSRAVVEATAFAMRDVIGVMESLGSKVSELRIVGSPARSPAWNQIKADVTGKPIVLPRCFEDAELQGDACIGLAATGRFGSLAEAAEETVKIGRIFQPDRSNAGLYDDLFGIYRSAYEALKPVFKRMAGC